MIQLIIIHSKAGDKLQSYSTSQIARIVNVHPNTVRFYEEVQLLPPIPRRGNGYRVYNDFHVQQLKLIQIAFDSEIVSGSLRKLTIDIVKLSASRNFNEAIHKMHRYKEQIMLQRQNAEEAITITENIMGDDEANDSSQLVLHTRKTAAAHLGITIDVLRDWERNGLIDVPVDANRNRVYGTQQIKRLKIIRTLRNAHYSMMAILRMLTQIDVSADSSIKNILNSPLPTEDIITVTDQFITSLSKALENSNKILVHLEQMKEMYAQ